MANSKKWYAVYTKPRWEKKVHRLLQEKGFDSYCPLNKVRRQWSDRSKIVEEPLFKSYVFVRVTEDEKLSVRMTNGIVNFVYWLGRPAVVKDKEIETIRLFLKDYSDIEVVALDIALNEKIRVRSGPLMNYEGEVIKMQSNYALVVIESLGYYLKARILKSDIEPIRNLKKN